MWGKKSKLSLIVYLSIHVLAATLVFGCENRKSFYDVNRDDVNKVPLQMENPEDPIPDEVKEVKKEEPEIVIVEHPQTEENPVVVTEEPEVVIPVPTPKPAPRPVRPPTPTKPQVSTNQPSKFIAAAFWVIENEARKIGTPCNFYVSRVLELSGYSDDNFLANDFDVYARKNFSSYNDEDFNTRNLAYEQVRLKRHLWSYPARTPFIFQWTRNGSAGHIAIVERIGEQLVVYQASLNRHIARREQTTVDRLLNSSRSARLTVYSEFIAR